MSPPPPQSVHPADIADLAGPGMPADRGLTGLGLIMQLAGSLAMGVFACAAIAALTTPDLQSWWVLLFGACAVRAGFHRAAGRTLVHAGASPACNGALRGVRTYLIVAAAQSLLAIVILRRIFGDQTPHLYFIALLAAWPAALAVILSHPRYRAMRSGPLPASEDLGLEGAGILMSLMGAAGTIVSGVLLLQVVRELDGGQRSMLLAVATLAALFFRSVIHVRTGFGAVRGHGADQLLTAGQRYCHFAIIASMVAGLCMLLTLLGAMSSFTALLPIGLVLYLLLAWPLILKRYLADRNFARLLAGERATRLLRAPDAGLTALGWLLVGLSVTPLLAQVATLCDQSTLTLSGRVAGQVGQSGARFLLEQGLSIASHALGLWAGLSLIAMSRRARLAATAYGVAGVVAAIALHWEALGSFDGLRQILQARDLSAALQGILPGLLALVVPVGTLLLIHRRRSVTARAV